MGANYSSSNDLSKDGFRHTIDYIATYYIVTMDFESLKKLTDREYCNQLIILTSDIISKYATTRDIKYMVKKQGDMYEPGELKSQKVTYFSKNMVDREIPEMVKKEMCMSIASFYIRIAHLFSAIILTINPVYKYRDESGFVKEVNWVNKKDIPEGVEVSVEYSNLCNNRINALEPVDTPKTDKGLFQSLSLGSTNVMLKPSICHLQFKPNLLIEEPGIKELETLYYDVYDYNEGKYNSMSPTSRQQYEEDVREFYKSFTGKHNQEVPPEIKSFNDIPIQQYNMCNNPDYEEPVSISSSNNIYRKYADNLNEMKRYAALNQEKLMDIVSKIFVYTVNKKTGKKQIRINPRLNDAMLDNLIQQSRTYISQLYVNCQQSYDKGVHLYQDIVESIISKTLDKRIDNAENEEYEEMKDINTIGDEPEPVNQYQEPSPFTPYKPEPVNQYQEPSPFTPYKPEPENQYQEPSPFTPYKSEPENQYQEPSPFTPYKSEPENQYQEPSPFTPYKSEPVNQYQEPSPFTPYKPEPVNQFHDKQYIPSQIDVQPNVSMKQNTFIPYSQNQVNPYSYQEPVNPYSYQEPVNPNPYQEPVNPNPYQEPVNSDIPTVYTNNDKYNKIDNILVSSLRESNNKGILSDRGVTEQLNKVEFERK